MTEIANTDQYQAWNGDSGHRWVLDADRRDHILAPVAEVLLAAAHLSAGEPVVDIGCGCGATTLAAAQVVGSTGAVYGIDLSKPMLGVARRRAEASGLANITLVQVMYRPIASRPDSTRRSAGSGRCSSSIRPPRSPTSDVDCGPAPGFALRHGSPSSQ